MTIREIDAELREIFEHKLALTSKIEYNASELYRIDRALENEKDERKIIALTNMQRKGKKLLEQQVSDRNKLSAEKIAKQLNSTRSNVTYRYNAFLGGRL